MSSPDGRTNHTLIELASCQSPSVRKLNIRIVGVLAIAALIGSTPLQAQTLSGKTTVAQSQKVPNWQAIAGDKMEFEAASVRPNNPDARYSGNVDLDASDYFRYTGGLVMATGLPVNYIIFAYKISDTSQYPLIQAQMPKWTQSEQFYVEARPPGKPTKDQVRLMIQSLLADRFKLAVHTEVRQIQVYALVLDKPGKPGPQLKPHPDDELCTVMPDQSVPAVHTATLAPFCGLLFARDGSMTHMKIASWTMGQIAGALSTTAARMGGLDLLPVLDETGLSGRFDIDVAFVRPPRDRPSGTDTEPEVPGTSFIEALKSQAGLKLVKKMGPVDVLVIDHMERPSEN
jgi:uncharacterized protein (TIGR03435 family)